MGIFSKDLTNGYIFNFLYFLTFPFYDYLKFSSVAFLKYMYAKYDIPEPMSFDPHFPTSGSRVHCLRFKKCYISLNLLTAASRS